MSQRVGWALRAKKLGSLRSGFGAVWKGRL
jgi:hypothetical protein